MANKPREAYMEIILVNHGSRRESFNYLMYKWAKELERRLGVPCVVGFNEYADPNWRDLLKRGNGPAVLALAFLGEGNHVARDILNELGVKPGEWAQSSYGRQIYVTPPLGNSPLVFTALLARVRESLGARPLDIVSEPEEIEESSMRYVAEALGLDLTQWKDRLVARVAYATGNLDVAKHLWVSDDLLDAAREAFMAEMPLLVDTKMVAAGVKYAKVHTAVGT
ncbi:MAG: precorrin-8X methylmutase, partial [Pyrobaculum sp.]